MAGKKHPGFKGAAKEVAQKQGIPMENANKIIGYGKAHASAAAKKANPRLLKKGGKKGK
jgi:hypothetical protein